MSEPAPSPKEALLIAAARAVLAALREPLEQRRLSGPATAALRLLETAVEPDGAEGDSQSARG